MFDVIFVDGNHAYDQVRRDVYNSLKFLSKDGIIIIHDMLPIVKEQTVVPMPHPTYAGWVGDVWRIAFDLMKEPNINFYIVNIDLGCGVIIPGVQETKIYPNKTWNDYVTNHNTLPITLFEEIKKIFEKIK
jgi:hypothetical protein